MALRRRQQLLSAIVLSIVLVGHSQEVEQLGNNAAQMGESQHAAKKYASAEEERHALETADHDEDIKAMEREEHLKAMEKAKTAEERFNTATHRKEESGAAAEKLKRRMERDLKAKNDAEAAYKKEHATALNAFAAA